MNRFSIKSMWEEQKNFERKFFEFKGLNFDKLTIDEKRFWSKEFYAHLIIELSETLNKMQYKMHRDYTNELNDFNLKESIIDSFKFMLGFSQIWFDDYTEFEKMFFEKSTVVDKRFSFEKVQNIANSEGGDIVIVDIDGVLANLEKDLYSFIMKDISSVIKYGMASCIGHESEVQTFADVYDSLKTTRDIKKYQPDLYELYKDVYRTKSHHRFLEVIDGAVEFTKQLKKLGLTIMIITARPYEKYNNLWADTMEWLDDAKIKYDALYFDNKKHEKIIKLFDGNIKRVKYVVDDLKSICDSFEKIGIKSFNVNHKDITFDSIIEAIKTDKKLKNKNKVKIKKGK